jgi:predicted acylesterase/phospholipase RssA
MWRAYRVLSWHVHTARLAAHQPDVLLQPDVGDYGSLDFKDIEGPLRAGEAEAEKHLAALRTLAVS